MVPCAHHSRFVSFYRSAGRTAASGRPFHLRFLGGSDKKSSLGYSSVGVIAFIIATLPTQALAIIPAINPSDPSLPLQLLLQTSIVTQLLMATLVGPLAALAEPPGIAGQ